ncbi:hypothetical protein F2Q70_00030832 [Brassica cretica]|uniref:Uncharacterized protein n=1 Tax=Brassica cretica TaxID=69181 RepID=A0A8S9FE77_BRACR|nr:hypothetical protein F2Q70_00030832 [Brassica cretica]
MKDKWRRGDEAMRDFTDSGFHESFAVETVILSSNEDPTEEYDEDYWKERATEIAMQDERYSTHSLNNTTPPSIDNIYSASVDTHPYPAKRFSTSIDTTPGTSIDVKAAALKKEKGNIPIPNRFTNTYIRSFAPQITSHETEAEKMNAPTNQSEGTSRKSIRSKNPNSSDKRLPSIDTPVSTSIDSHSKPKLSFSTKKNMSIDYDFLLPDEFGILQLANGADNLFMQQRNIPDNNPTVPDKYPRATTIGIDSHQSCRPVGQASIDNVSSTSFDRVTPTSIDKAPSPSINRRYECGRRAYDSYEARKFRWEQKDEYGVYRDESGHTRSVAGEMIPVTKDNIRKILERASLFQESHICLPEHATSFTPTRLTPEIYTKDEINEMINEMVTGICGAQEKLGDELKTLHRLEKEATTSPSIDANKATSIDVKPQTSQISVELERLAEKKDEWEIAYINARINDVYNPLNNNVDWLSTRIDLLQQDLETIRMNDPQPATSIDICNTTSIDTGFAAMEDRLKSYEDMHNRFTSLIMRYFDTLSTQMMNVQRDIGKLNDQHDFQEEGSTSIDRFRRTSLDGKKPTEHLPYTTSETDCVTPGQCNLSLGGDSTKMLKWINLSTIHTCLDCLKEPNLTSNTKPDINACLGAWYTWDQILQTSLEGQKEVNRAWWQPPLRLDSWKSVQSLALILQWKQTLTQERN